MPSRSLSSSQWKLNRKPFVVLIQPSSICFIFTFCKRLTLPRNSHVCCKGWGSRHFIAKLHEGKRAAPSVFKRVVPLLEEGRARLVGPRHPASGHWAGVKNLTVFSHWMFGRQGYNFNSVVYSWKSLGFFFFWDYFVKKCNITYDEIYHLGYFYYECT